MTLCFHSNSNTNLEQSINPVHILFSPVLIPGIVEKNVTGFLPLFKVVLPALVTRDSGLNRE